MTCIRIGKELLLRLYYILCTYIHVRSLSMAAGVNNLATHVQSFVCHYIFKINIKGLRSYVPSILNNLVKVIIMYVVIPYIRTYVCKYVCNNYETKYIVKHIARSNVFINFLTAAYITRLDTSKS